MKTFTPTSLHHEKEELDLVHLTMTLWHQKWIILFILIVFASSGYWVAKQVKPLYQVNFGFMQPLLSDLAPVNTDRKDQTDFKPVLPKDVYRLFQNYLFSDNTLIKFKTQVQNKSWFGPEQHNIPVFEPSLTNSVFFQIRPLKHIPHDYPVIEVRADSQAKALEIGRAYINYVSNLTKTALINSLDAETKLYQQLSKDKYNLPALINDHSAAQKEGIEKMLIVRVDGPVSTEQPVNTRKKRLIILLSVLGGLFLGIAYATLRARLNYSTDCFRNRPHE